MKGYLSAGLLLLTCLVHAMKRSAQDYQVDGEPHRKRRRSQVYKWRTALKTSCINGNLAELKAHIKGSTFGENEHLALRDLCLGHAVRNDRIRIMDYLLSYRVTINEALLKSALMRSDRDVTVALLRRRPAMALKPLALIPDRSIITIYGKYGHDILDTVILRSRKCPAKFVLRILEAGDLAMFAYFIQRLGLDRSVGFITRALSLALRRGKVTFIIFLFKLVDPKARQHRKHTLLRFCRMILAAMRGDNLEAFDAACQASPSIPAACKKECALNMALMLAKPVFIVHVMKPATLTKFLPVKWLNSGIELARLNETLPELLHHTLLNVSPLPAVFKTFDTYRSVFSAMIFHNDFVRFWKAYRLLDGTMRRIFKASYGRNSTPRTIMRLLKCCTRGNLNTLMIFLEACPSDLYVRDGLLAFVFDPSNEIVVHLAINAISA